MKCALCTLLTGTPYSQRLSERGNGKVNLEMRCCAAMLIMTASVLLDVLEPGQPLWRRKLPHRM